MRLSSTDALPSLAACRQIEPAGLTKLVRGELDWIVMKSLEKDRNRRYDTANSLAMDVQRYLAAEPVLAAPPSTRYRLRKFARKHHAALTTAAAIAILLIAGIAVSTWQALRASRAEVLANGERDRAVQAETNARDQRDKAIAAEKQVLAEKQRADEALTQAGLAVRAFRTLIDEAQKETGDNPGMQALKGKLLETALGGLDKVAKTDEDSRLLGQSTAGAYLRIGQLYQQMGQSDKALAQFQKCHEIVSALAAKDPNSIVGQANLAATYTAMGELVVERGDILASLGYYQKALDIRNKLLSRPLAADPDPSRRLDPVEAKVTLAESYTRVGVTYLKLWEPKKAGEYFSQAQALRQELVSAAPTDTPARVERARSLQLDLARSHNALAEVRFRARDWAAAEENFQQALAICDRVARANPQKPLYKWDLTNTLGNFGVFDVRTGRLDEARQHYARYLTLTQELADLDPKNALFQRYLGLANYRSATLATRLNDADTARRCNEKCWLIRERLAAVEAKSERRRIELMLILPRCGQHARAAGEAAKLRNSKSIDREVLVEVAQCYAQCAAAVPDNPELSRQYRENAHEALTQAVAQGFKDLVILETEPDLDALRDQPTFQALLDKLRKGV
jgi:tetratricopeptide (TPR) repeat protein